jgi:hypothetical protein
VLGPRAGVDLIVGENPATEALLDRAQEPSVEARVSPFFFALVEPGAGEISATPGPTHDAAFGKELRLG